MEGFDNSIGARPCAISELSPHGFPDHSQTRDNFRINLILSKMNSSTREKIPDEFSQLLKGSNS